MARLRQVNSGAKKAVSSDGINKVAQLGPARLMEVHYSVEELHQIVLAREGGTFYEVLCSDLRRLPPAP